MAALERFRKAGKKVVRQQRFVRPLQEAVYEVRLPTLDDHSISISAGKLKGQPVRFLSTGRVLVENTPTGSQKQGQVSFQTGESAPTEGNEDGGEETSLEPGDEEFSKYKEKRELSKSRRWLSKSMNWTGGASIGHVPGVGGYTSALFNRLIDKGLLRIQKTIRAGQDVLATYYEAYLYGDVPRSVKLRSHLRNGRAGYILRIFEAIATIASIALYIRTTYTVDTSGWTKGFQLGITIFFVVDYMLNIYSAPLRVAYLLSVRGLIDFVSCLPVIFIYTNDAGNGGIPQVLTFFRALRVLPVIRQLGFVSNTILQQMIVLCAWVVAILFVGAGIFQWVEKEATSTAVKEENGCGRLGCYTFFDSFYFMVVTVSTVGFGDITANSNWGRAIVILALILALTYIPAQVNRILNVASMRPYGGTFSGRQVVGSRYIILWGVASFRAIQEFLAQMYHPVHDDDLAAFPLRVVIMAPGKPSFELRSLISLYGGLVAYVEGKLIKPGDLDRVAAPSASAFFLLADKHAPDYDDEDSMQFIRSLIVNRTCGPNVRVIVEMLKPRNQGGAIWDDTAGVEVICVDAMRFKLLARGCSIKGLTTFCTNLFRTGLTISRRGPKEHWMNEYAHGQENEVYPLLIPPTFHNMRFEEVAEFVYRHYGVVIFALDVVAANTVTSAASSDMEGCRQLLLYPRGHVIAPHDVALAIAPDLHTAERVSTCGSIGSLSIWQEDGTGREMRKVFRPQNLSRRVRRRRVAEAQNVLESIRERWRRELGSLPSQPTAKQANRGAVDSSAHASPSGWLSARHARPGGVEMTARTSHVEHRGSGSNEEHKAHNGKGVEAFNTGLPSSSTPQAIQAGNRAVAVSYQSAVASNQEDLSSDVPGGLQTVDPMECMEVHDAPGGNSFARTNQSPEIDRGQDTSTDNSQPSLEDVVEKVLMWPPTGGAEVRPHPAVIEHHKDAILDNLKSHTLTAVYLERPHILVAMPANWPENFFCFVAALRLEGLHSPPIVIVRAEDPTHQQWGTVGQFADVYFVKGSPVYELDLMRAGIFNAEKVVILAADATADPAEDEDTDADMQSYDPNSFSRDMKNVVIVANVERLLKSSRRSGRVMCEVHYEMSFSYLRPTHPLDRSRLQRKTYERNREAVFHFSPPYMEGKAFCASALQFLMYKTFYNRNTVSIMEQLVGGGPVAGSPLAEDASKPALRHLEQIPAPPEFAGMEYGDLFVELLHTRQMLALGLFRCKGSMGSPTPYVFTNPWAKSLVREGDLVYVLV